MNRAVVFAVVLGMLVALAAAGHASWNDRANTARKGRMCKDGSGKDSWNQRYAYERCTTCHSRCYYTKFNTTAVSNGAPYGLCNSIGDECTVELYIKTEPCCECGQGHGQVDTLEETDLESLEVLDTFSSCEVVFMGTMINGYWTMPLDASCNITKNPLFTQQWVRNDCTVNKIFDCDDGSYQSGAVLRQAYKNNYRNGRYPDPCFADKYWVDSYASAEKGVITSAFEMFRPNSNTMWFDQPLTRKDAPTQIPCGRIPEHIPVYTPPMV